MAGIIPIPVTAAGSQVSMCQHRAFIRKSKNLSLLLSLTPSVLCLQARLKLVASVFTPTAMWRRKVNQTVVIFHKTS